MKKIKLITSLIAVGLTLSLLVTLSFAWYVNMTNVKDLGFDILQIDSLVTVYQGYDTNYNGIPDLLDDDKDGKYYSEEAEAHIDYINPYYDEHMNFNFIDSKYALSVDSSANLLNRLNIVNCAPSQVFTFKIEITNYSGFENDLSFEFIKDSQDPVYSSSDLDILSSIDVRLGIINQDGTKTFTEWTNFVSDGEYTPFALNPVLSGMKIPGRSAGLHVGRCDLWLQFKIDNDLEDPITGTFLEATEGITGFVLPKYRLTLSCDVADISED